MQAALYPGESRKADTAPPGASHPLGQVGGALRLAVKEAHANRKDLVEAALTEFQLLEGRD